MSLAVLQCYKSENEKYKATILPLHRAIGITIFLLSIASAITGITQTERRRYLRNKLYDNDDNKLYLVKEMLWLPVTPHQCMKLFY